jgi:hypothetical protein
VVVYKKGQYAVYNVNNGFVIHNTNYKFAKKHTHINKLDTCKQIIKNIWSNKIPKTRNIYLLTSYTRVAEEQKYIIDIQNIIDKHKNKQQYYNVNKVV